MKTSRTTETISFDRGISMAEYNEQPYGQSKAGAEPPLLPGSTTVSQALLGVFPESESVNGEIMRALVAGNSAFLRTPNGFNETARQVLRKLRAKGTPAAEAAVSELTALLADTELFEHYRSTLLES
jgi:hypothetical protein